MAETDAKPQRRPGIGTFIALAIAFIILIALGTWQVERLQWKEGLIAEIEARRSAAPITADAAAAMVARGEDVDYLAITVTGRFDNTRERDFLATSDGEPGFYVYTPLVQADRKIILVNRGFVPDQLRYPAKRPQSLLEGEVTVTGLARAKLQEKPSSMVPDNDPARNMFFWKDMDVMASSAGLDKAQVLPFFVDAGPAANPGGYPIGGVTQIDLPNNHLSYAVTWYGLAAALVVIAAMAMRRRKVGPENSN